MSGFGLKVTPAGGKVYVFQYRLARPGEAERTPARRYTVGKHGKLTPDQARKRAKALAALVEHGIDPREQEAAERASKDEAARMAQERARLDGDLVFEKIAALWLEHYEIEKDRRPSSVKLAKLVVNNHLKPTLKGNPMPHIGRAELQPIIDAIPVKQRGMRRAVFAYASVLFGWAAKRGDISANPLASMAKPEAPKSRDRVLSDHELATLWKATDDLGKPFGPFFRLLILTGQRRSEVAAINWAELDRATATWTIPAGRAKNGVAHIVPLSPEAKVELDRLAKVGTTDEHGREIEHWPKTGYVLTTTDRTPISGITKAKNALDAQAKKDRDGKTLEPKQSFGVKVMSMGFLIEEDTPMIWRGPMVMSAITQLLREVNWGELDILVCDLPPGTGDAQLTMAQSVPLSGAVIVSTPQDIALLDAKKGLNMFRKVDVPVLGIIENMSYFSCPNCGHRTDIFAHGGAQREAAKFGVDFLGEIPLDIVIRETSDAGTPIVASNPTSAHSLAYGEIAAKIWRKLDATPQRAAPRIVLQ